MNNIYTLPAVYTGIMREHSHLSELGVESIIG